MLHNITATGGSLRAVPITISSRFSVPARPYPVDNSLHGSFINGTGRPRDKTHCYRLPLFCSRLPGNPGRNRYPRSRPMAQPGWGLFPSYPLPKRRRRMGKGPNRDDRRMAPDTTSYSESARVNPQALLEQPWFRRNANEQVILWYFLCSF